MDGGDWQFVSQTLGRRLLATGRVRPTGGRGGLILVG